MNAGQVITPEMGAGRRAPGNAAGSTTDSVFAIERKMQSETAAEVLAAQAKAAIQARYIMAMERPRDPDIVRQKILHDCERSSFAETAIYSKPVGNTSVTGLSVRFAEAVWRHWGNGLIDPAIVYDDATKRIVRVTGTDLETNVTYSKDLLIEKTVERRSLKAGQKALSSRLNSYGDTVYLIEATEDDLLVKEAAQMAKARRQLILQLVPGDIQDECQTAIKATLKEKMKRDPDGEKKKLLDAFDDLGVRADQIKAFLDLPDLASLTPKDLTTLRGIFTAIRDGETNWREVMEQRDRARGKSADDDKPPASGKAAEILDQINRGGKAATAATGQPRPAGTDKPAPEGPQSPAVASVPASGGEPTPETPTPPQDPIAPETASLSGLFAAEEPATDQKANNPTPGRRAR